MPPTNHSTQPDHCSAGAGSIGQSKQRAGSGPASAQLGAIAAYATNEPQYATIIDKSISPRKARRDAHSVTSKTLGRLTGLSVEKVHTQTLFFFRRTVTRFQSTSHTACTSVPFSTHTVPPTLPASVPWPRTVLTPEKTNNRARNPLRKFPSLLSPGT